MPHPKHILVVSCLVQNSAGSVLLVKHKIRGWELPQGRVEEGEALIDALHREVLEETGVTITRPKLATIWSKLTESFCEATKATPLICIRSSCCFTI